MKPLKQYYDEPLVSDIVIIDADINDLEAQASSFRHPTINPSNQLDDESELGHQYMLDGITSSDGYDPRPCDYYSKQINHD